MRRISIFAVLAWTCIPGLTWAAAPAPAPRLELAPCTTIPGLPPEARCGTYEVWENRAAKSGRKIPLRVVVIPALGPDRLPDPFTYFEGGPGQSSVVNASWIVQELGALRKQRDILLVDFRGTGGSAGLFCPEMQGSTGLQGALDNFYTPEEVKACADRLRATVDLSQYTNDTSVDDIDEVRAALGYGKLNIYGASGGSRAALVYLRRHPESVRTLVLGGVVPMDERGPFSMAQSAQRALDGLIAECEGDEGCRTAFPKLRDEVAAVLRQSAKEPVTVALTDGETGQPVDIRLTRNGLAQILRYMLYNPQAASLLPLKVHLAAQGNWKPLAENARSLAFRGGTSLADGYYLSLTCSEDVPFIREDEIPAAVQGTFLGDLRIRKQQAACEAWPVPPVSRAFLDPVTSDVPTLLLSGERDPVTPPGNAERAARTLRNSLQVIVPDGGHGFGGIEGAYECFNRLIVQLVESGTVQGLDTSCMTHTKRADFVLKQDPDVEVPVDQLARLTGTYKDRESGYEVRIEIVGKRLRAVDSEGGIMILAAASPTRFRPEGLAGTLTFQLSDGRATAAVLEAPGAPSLTLARADLAAASPRLELKPCTTTLSLPPEARCGTYEVWENRAAKSGRKIPLRVAVLPALGPDRLPDAFTVFAGGPGESNVATAPDFAEMFGEIRKRRDILLVDFRGTGGSGGLFCPEMQGSAGVQGLLDSFYPPEKVKACAERLAKTADFSQYTNDTSVDDIDEVRAALGYEKLNIYGGSGGSRTVLVYLRRHPDKVRTAIVSGVAPPDERGPFAMARHAQRALDGLIAECEGDAACRGAFPRLRDEVAAVLQQAEKEPVTVTLTDGETGRPVEVRLTRNGVAQTLRYMLYRPLSSSMLPLSLHLAAQGDWKPLAESGVHFAAGRDWGTIADGYYLSLTCSEDLPFIREDEIPAAVQGTFLGEFRIRKQQEACAAWPVPPVDRKFLDPVVSDVPTPLISGERDPVTPPINGERAARTLKNSLQAVQPDAGHGSFGIEGALECGDGLIHRFIEAGTVKGLDTSCLGRSKRPEFTLRWDPEVELPADQLARLAGTYKDRESGREIRIQTAGRRLQLLEGENPPRVLVPISLSRFRVEGMPPNYAVDFQITEGRATACTTPWAPAQPYTREGP
jgi:pimeloyl-ACP methyl ester carboxylesterase